LSAEEELRKTVEQRLVKQAKLQQIEQNVEYVLSMTPDGVMRTAELPNAYFEQYQALLDYKAVGFPKLGSMLNSFQGILRHKHSITLTTKKITMSPLAPLSRPLPLPRSHSPQPSSTASLSSSYTATSKRLRHNKPGAVLGRNGEHEGGTRDDVRNTQRRRCGWRQQKDGEQMVAQELTPQLLLGYEQFLAEVQEVDTPSFGAEGQVQTGDDDGENSDASDNMSELSFALSDISSDGDDVEDEGEECSEWKLEFSKSRRRCYYHNSSTNASLFIADDLPTRWVMGPSNLDGCEYEFYCLDSPMQRFTSINAAQAHIAAAETTARKISDENATVGRGGSNVDNTGERKKAGHVSSPPTGSLSPTGIALPPIVPSIGPPSSAVLPHIPPSSGASPPPWNCTYCGKVCLANNDSCVGSLAEAGCGRPRIHTIYCQCHDSVGDLLLDRGGERIKEVVKVTGVKKIHLGLRRPGGGERAMVVTGRIDNVRRVIDLIRNQMGPVRILRRQGYEGGDEEGGSRDPRGGVGSGAGGTKRPRDLPLEPPRKSWESQCDHLRQHTDAEGGNKRRKAEPAYQVPGDRRLFINGLKVHTSEDALREYAQQFGEVTDATMCLNGQHFGFVTFKNCHDAEKALRSKHTNSSIAESRVRS
jgi:hypothetical protein